MAPAFEPFFTQFQPGELGRRFCIWHAPNGTDAPRGLVVHVHAFAEEMNKSRRMCALQARALAAAGFAVLQFDLLGCGDSDGEFSDASWAAWLDDVAAALALARERHAQCWPRALPPTVWIWGQRAGALLAAEAANHVNGPVNLLLWQPTPNGKSVLQQFLRLETVGALLGNGAEKGSARAALARGDCAEVAGYALAPGLTSGLEAARLRAPALAGRLEWLDVAATAGQAPSPAADTVLKTWSDAGWLVRHQTVAGPSFWQTTEMEEAPALVTTTVDALRSPAGAATALQQVAA